MINLVNSIIKDAVALISDSEYLRATDLDANTTTADIELAGKTFAIFNNLPEITFDDDYLMIATIPVEVRFLELAEEFDNTSQSDDIRSRLIPVALSVYNSINTDNRISLAEPSSSPNIVLEGNVKLYDSIVTGVTLEFEMNLNNTNQCPA